MLVLVDETGTKIGGPVPPSLEEAENQVKSANLSSIEHMSGKTLGPDEVPLVLIEVAQEVEVVATESGIVVANIIEAAAPLEARRPEQLPLALHRLQVLEVPGLVALGHADQELMRMDALGLACLAGGLGYFVGDAPLPGAVLLGEVLAAGGVQAHVYGVLAEGVNLGLVGRIEEAGSDAGTFPQLDQACTDFLAHLGIYEPQLVGVRVPAVGQAVGHFQGANEALEADGGLELGEGTATAETLEGVGLALQEVAQGVETGMGEGERNHDRLEALTLCPFDQVLQFQPATLLDLGSTDRASPNTAAGGQVAIVGRQALGVPNLDHATGSDVAAVEGAEHLARKLDVREHHVDPATDPDTGLMQGLEALRACFPGTDFAGGGGRGFRSYT